MRLDRWLRDRYPGLTQSQAREIFERGWVRDGSGRALAKGDVVVPDVDLGAWEDRLRALRAPRPELGLAVLAEAADFWVVDKPAGLLGHPLRIDDVATVTQWAFGRSPALAEAFPEPVATVTPHRLDRGTSGCLVVAKSRAGFERWREAFSAHAIEKTYLAWTWGTGGEAHVARRSIGPVPGDRTRRRVLEEGSEGEGAYPAETRLKPLESRLGMTLWKATCRTGVTHQVRVHLAAAGFPLVGDALYDVEFSNRPRSPAHHWLRAIVLRSPWGEFRASEDAFRKLPTEEARPAPLGASGKDA
jgi:23S rRNA pseudouridine1911/1915/1917 synthase